MVIDRNSEAKEIVKKLLELLGKNSLDIFFETLYANLRADSPKFKTRVNLLSRYNKLKEDRIKGLLEESTNTRQHNDIINSCIMFCEELSVKDLAINSNETINTVCLETIHEKDINNIDKYWNVRKLFTQSTIFIIVGTHIFAELTDRICAEKLRDKINTIGKYAKGERAIILTDVHFQHSAKRYGNNCVISVGGDSSNEKTLLIENELDKVYADDTTRITYSKNNKILKVAVYGITANDTRKAVDKFINKDKDGLSDFLEYAWKKIE